MKIVNAVAALLGLAAVSCGGKIPPGSADMGARFPDLAAARDLAVGRDLRTEDLKMPSDLRSNDMTPDMPAKDLSAPKDLKPSKG